MDAFRKIDGAFVLNVLKVSFIPTDIVALEKNLGNYIPEPCRVAANKQWRLSRVMEQKPVNDGVRRVLHQQKDKLESMLV